MHTSHSDLTTIEISNFFLRFQEATHKRKSDSNHLGTSLKTRFENLLELFKQIPLPSENEKKPSPSLTVKVEECKPLIDLFAFAYKILEKQHAENPPNFNIWHALEIGDNEIQICKILTWFLDPNANHMQGNRFFRCFLGALPYQHLHNSLADETIYVRKEIWIDDTNRIDILITGESFVLGIEAKTKDQAVLRLRTCPVPYPHLR